MSNFLSPVPVLFEKSEKISSLHEKSIALVSINKNIVQAKIRVNECDPYSSDRDKVSVSVRDTFGGEGEWAPAAVFSDKPSEFPEGHNFEKFLTADGLASIRPSSAGLPVETDFELDSE